MNARDGRHCPVQTGCSHPVKYGVDFWELKELSTGHLNSTNKTSVPSLLDATRGPGSSHTPSGAFV